jgi:sugar-specific transcriptional regulator TrmB
MIIEKAKDLCKGLRDEIEIGTKEKQHFQEQLKRLEEHLDRCVRTVEAIESIYGLNKATDENLLKE